MPRWWIIWVGTKQLKFESTSQKISVYVSILPPIRHPMEFMSISEHRNPKTNHFPTLATMDFCYSSLTLASGNNNVAFPNLPYWVHAKMKVRPSAFSLHQGTCMISFIVTLLPWYGYVVSFRLSLWLITTQGCFKLWIVYILSSDRHKVTRYFKLLRAGIETWTADSLRQPVILHKSRSEPDSRF